MSICLLTAGTNTKKFTSTSSRDDLLKLLRSKELLSLQYAHTKHKTLKSILKVPSQ